jgi:hypothetical protein
VGHHVKEVRILKDGIEQVAQPAGHHLNKVAGVHLTAALQ